MVVLVEEQPQTLALQMLVVQELPDRVMLVGVMADLPQAHMVLVVVEAQGPQQPHHQALSQQQVVLG